MSCPCPSAWCLYCICMSPSSRSLACYLCNVHSVANLLGTPSSTRSDTPLHPEHPEFFKAWILQEAFLGDVGPWWHDGITQLLQIGRRYIHATKCPFHLIPKMLYWVWSAIMFRHAVFNSSLSWYQGTYRVPGKHYPHQYTTTTSLYR
jgi:hypothetical protein